MQGFLIGSVLINHDSQRAVHEGDVVVLGGKTRWGDVVGAARRTLLGVVAGDGQCALKYILGLLGHEALVRYFVLRCLLTANHLGIINLDGERRLLDGKLRSLGAGVVAFTSGGHLSCTGIHVVSISQCIVSAFHKNRLAVLHSNSRLLLSAVVHILSGIKRHD